MTRESLLTQQLSNIPNDKIEAGNKIGVSQLEEMHIGEDGGMLLYPGGRKWLDAVNVGRERKIRETGSK